MLTFQILDGGVTFFVPLEGKPLTIGSDKSCDVRLSEAGVAPLHARVEPVRSFEGPVSGDRTNPGSPEESYKIVDLAAEAVTEAGTGHATTRVNGIDIAQVRLALGDRVEIGCAVLVLGRRVQRQNTPQDVLEQAPRLERTKRQRLPESNRGQLRMAVILVISGLLVTVLYLGMQGSADLTPPMLLTSAEQMRRSGDFERAEKALQRAEVVWSAGDQARSQMVDAARAALMATKEEVVRTRDRVISELPTRTYKSLFEDLRATERAGAGAASEAARIVLSELPELHRLAASRPASDRTDLLPSEQAERQAGQQVAIEHGTQPTVGQGAKVDPVPEAKDPIADEVDLVLAQVDTFAKAGEYGKAYELIVQGMGSFPSKHALRLRDRLDEMRPPLRSEIERIVSGAEALATAGQLEAAVQSLRDPATRFPSTGEFAGVYNALTRMQSELDVRRNAPAKVATTGRPDPAGGPRRVETLQSVAHLLEQVRVAEISCEFRHAATLLQEGAATVEERDPLLSKSLAGRAADFEHLAVFEQELETRLETASGIEVDLGGQPARFEGVKSHRFQVSGIEGQQTLALLDVPLPTLAALASKVGLPAAARLGLAVAAYRHGDAVLAEAELHKAWNADASLSAAIQDVIRRGRTEAPDPRGYTVVGGRFVGLREIAADKLAKELEGKLTQALNGSPATRTKVLEQILGGGPESLDALLLALKRKQESLIQRIDRHPFQKTVTKFAALRVELDQARSFAKALIYDETTYFYPFAPPAVDQAKARLYWPVQQDVDRRVAALRTLWQSKERARIPKVLLDDAGQLEWIAEVLSGFGAADPTFEAKSAWVRALPDGGELTLQNFCVDHAEKLLVQHWNDTEIFNEKKSELMNEAERAQLKVTNEYRRMFHHRPLAVHPALLRATRAHSQEMSRLGYFGHFSPVPGRRTPFDRMRLAGYHTGVSENCAVNDSAVSAHNAWLRSAGHHRNLLSPGHKEFGVGNDGRYWTQNFGHGSEYMKDPDFPHR